jgi:hypothetical protein
MPAESEAQRKAAGAALAAKRGETDPGDLYGAAKDMYKSMSESQLEDFAKKASFDAAFEEELDKIAVKRFQTSSQRAAQAGKAPPKPKFLPVRF